MKAFLKGKDHFPAILLMHSLSDSGKVMAPLAHRLNKLGYTVYFPTFKGHGTEAFTDLFAVGIKDWLEDGEGFLQELRDKNYSNIIVSGLSLGGLVAVELASKHPDLLGLITLAAPMLGDLSSTKVPLYIRQQYYQSLGRLPEASDRLEGEKYFARLDEQLLEINQWMEHVFTDLFTLKMPVLIAQGEKDEVINPKWAHTFKRSLKASAYVDFKWYLEGSHYLVAPPTRDALVEDIHQFIQKITHRK